MIVRDFTSTVGVCEQIGGGGGELVPGAATVGQQGVGGAQPAPVECLVLRRHPVPAVAAVRLQHRQALPASAHLPLL